MQNYTFRKQIKNRGCYAEIIFEANLLREEYSALEIKYLADKEWEIACKAGVLVFHNYFGWAFSGGLEITIYEVRWLPADTDNLIVLFATIEALCEALNVQTEKLKFDTLNEVFLFPERRSL